MLAAKGYTVESTNGKMDADGNAALAYKWTQEAFDAETSSINTFAQVFKHYKISNLTKDCGNTLTQTNMAC